MTPQAPSPEDAARHALGMMSGGASRREILTHLANAAEEACGPGTVVSILVLDEEGLLRNGASPNLPPDDLAAIDRLRPNANLGTCAAAAATGKIVGAWSMPIKSDDGKVLGTFGTYYRVRREPTPREHETVSVLATAAAKAIAAAS